MQGEIVSTVNMPGLVISGKTTRTETGAIVQGVALPGGKAGTLSTRTDNDTGIATLSSGHGLVQNDKVDVYWPAGVRFGMIVGVVAGDNVPIDLGAGAVLPAQGTALVVCKRTVIDVDFDGDLMVLFACHATDRGHVEFTTEADASLKAIELVANEPYTWASGQGITNPLTGTPVGKVQASSGTTTGCTVSIAVLYDSTV